MAIPTRPHDARLVLIERRISSRTLTQWVNDKLPEHRRRDETSVSDYLNRRTVPGADWTQAASEALGLPVGELFDFSPEPASR